MLAVSSVRNEATAEASLAAIFERRNLGTASAARTIIIPTTTKSSISVKPGMTRNDLLRVFTIEGGLSNRLHRTYVYKRCPYIKVAVEFEAVGNPEDILTEMPADKIEKISTPFLQYSVMD